MPGVRTRARQLLWRLAPRRLHLRWRAKHILANGEPEVRLLLPLLGECGRLVDVGANDGPYSFVAAAAGRHVVAFEPNADIASRLRRDLRHYAEVYQVALSDSAGRSAFYVPFDGDTVISTRGALDSRVHAIYSQRRVDVELATLDTYALRDVGVIKVDVEGHERQVLSGALKTLERERPHLILEIEDHRAPGNLSSITTMLKGLGYRGFFLLGDNVMSVEEFDLEKYQRPEHAPLFGERRDPLLYVSNFIWISPSRTVAGPHFDSAQTS